MATFSAEIWTPGLGATQASRDRPTNPHRSVSTPTSGKPPIAPVGSGVAVGVGDRVQQAVAEQQQAQAAQAAAAASNGVTATNGAADAQSQQSHNSLGREAGHHQHNSSLGSLSRELGHGRVPERRDSQSSVHSNGSQGSAPTSPNLSGMPPRRNILYRIFHPNDSDDNGRLARSRRSYGSGSEAESEDDYHSDDSCATADGDGMFGNGGASRRPSATAHPETQKLNAAKPKNSAPAMFHSSDSESDTDTESLGRKKGKNGGGNIFKGILQGGKKKDKDKDKTSAPTSPNLSSSASHHSSGDDSSTRSSDSETESVVHEGKHNLFKDLMMGGRKSKSGSSNGSDKGSAAPSRKPSVNGNSTDLGVPHLAANGSPLLAAPVGVVTSPAFGGMPGMARSVSETSLSKYGKKEEVLGKGANAVVRLCCPVNSDKKYAIKEFRKRRRDETQKEYVKKLIAEFCISST
ncbi:serine/threonine-protein kinase HAL4/sat4, partial [Rhizophlyctis rosea]